MVGSSAAERTSAPSNGSPSGHLGGARADFVAALGKRTAGLSALLHTLERDPRATPAMAELSRRMEQLAKNAAWVGLVKVSEEVASARVLLDAATRRGEIDAPDRQDIADAIGRLSELAWSEPDKTSPKPPPVVAPAPVLAGKAVPPLAPLQAASPRSVLVFGDGALAETLRSEFASDAIEIEHSVDRDAAIALVRAFAPDVILVDAGPTGSRALVDALIGERAGDPVPIITLGHLGLSGVTRELTAPLGKGELREAVEQALLHQAPQSFPAPNVGEVSLSELGDLLATELRRGLTSASQSDPGARVDLGAGSEVLAAVWGTVARVRDVVTVKSGGEVRFQATGPEGSLPLAARLDDSDSFGGERVVPSPHGRTTGDDRLDGLTILVADDDSAVRWFLAGVLRAAGAEVLEALNGTMALDTALSKSPDLVLCDVVMPGLDGFALCRALKRDVALRDTPVILLSWKEDLLQRVRELGVGADGYLRKEASAPVVVQRVREVMRPRRRLGERLAAGGDVRGRVDGVTVGTLLALSAEHRPNSNLTVRDASFTYEVHLRAGRPVRAMRSGPEQGATLRGPDAVAAILGVGSGRFSMVDATDALDAPVELTEDVATLFCRPVARARAAQRLLSGGSLVHVEQVVLYASAIAEILQATPEPARALIERLMSGASPRALVTSGQAPTRLLEDILCDAAARGAISAILDASGVDLLEAAADHELAVLCGDEVRTAAFAWAPPVIEERAPVSAEMFATAEASAMISAPAADAATADAVIELDDSDVLEVHDPGVLTRSAPLYVEPREDQDPTAPRTVRPAEQAPIFARAPLPPRVESPALETPLPAPRVADAPRPSAYFSPKNTEKRSSRRGAVAMWVALATLGVAFAMVSRKARLGSDESSSVTTTPPVDATTLGALPAPSLSVASVASVRAPDAAPAATAEDLPLRGDDRVLEGQGMLEIIAGTKDGIFVDHRLIGDGPLQKLTLAARKEPYEVRVRLRGEERVRLVSVRAGRLARLRVAPPWSR